MAKVLFILATLLILSTGCFNETPAVQPTTHYESLTDILPPELQSWQYELSSILGLAINSYTCLEVSNNLSIRDKLLMNDSIVSMITGAGYLLDANNVDILINYMDGQDDGFQFCCMNDLRNKYGCSIYDPIHDDLLEICSLTDNRSVKEMLKDLAVTVRDRIDIDHHMKETYYIVIISITEILKFTDCNTGLLRFSDWYAEAPENTSLIVGSIASSILSTNQLREDAKITEVAQEVTTFIVASIYDLIEITPGEPVDYEFIPPPPPPPMGF